jgi:outer membrane protein assembly factor BamC
MLKMKRVMQGSLMGLIAVVVLSGCGVMDKYKEQKKKIDYRSSEEVPELEIPPDLTTSSMEDAYRVPDLAPASGSASLQEYTAERISGPAVAVATVLPPQDEIRVVRDSHQRWLVIQATPDQVFPRVREFWLKNGFLIDMEDPRIGIMETDWAENRADIPDGPIRNFLKGALDILYSTGTRDKFRVRLERTDAGETELFLSHQRVEEKAQGEGFVWENQGALPELEAELLARLMSFLGVEERRARATVADADASPVEDRAQLVARADESPYLLVREDFARAWRRTGHALDRVGFTVVDRNRSEGLYYVRYLDIEKDAQKKGLLDKLAFWKGKDKPAEGEYRIRIETIEGVSRIQVLNNEGAPEASETASRILSLVLEQLK